MPRQTIVAYTLAWYPGSNRAQCEIRLADGRSRKVPVESAAELAALAAVLDRGPAYLEDDGRIVRETEVGAFGR
ncbi:MAG TPA: hypothetical protein VLA75_13150 [Thermoanaerobaculia bacterium]|nr:hypothetical protein [Thermoanaerobaculia bacterium]